jgi:hypothetical protein
MSSELLKKTIRHYALAFCVFWLGATLLCKGSSSSGSSPEFDLLFQLQIVIGVFLVHGWVYFVHRGLHLIHELEVLDFLNTHMVYHHQSDKTIPRYLELFYEGLTDLSMNLSLIPVQWLIGVELIPTPVILLFALTYSSIHIINYSIVGSTFHRRHHTSLNKNYAPDAMDHLCGTNYNEEFEDLNPTCLNIIGVVALLYPLKDYIF